MIFSPVSETDCFEQLRSAPSFGQWGSGAATVDVVGVGTPQKFKLGVSDTQKKLKGNIKPTS